MHMLHVHVHVHVNCTRLTRLLLAASLLPTYLLLTYLLLTTHYGTAQCHLAATVRANPDPDPDPYPNPTPNQLNATSQLLYVRQREYVLLGAFWTMVCLP